MRPLSVSRKRLSSRSPGARSTPTSRKLNGSRPTAGQCADAGSRHVDVVPFCEGDTVREGQPLFRIDLRPFEAAVARAKTGPQLAEACEPLTRWETGRVRHLRARQPSQPRRGEKPGPRAPGSALRCSCLPAMRALLKTWTESTLTLACWNCLTPNAARSRPISGLQPRHWQRLDNVSPYRAFGAR